MKIRLNLDVDDVDLFLDKIIRKYHYEAEDKNKIKKVFDELMIFIKPYAVYRKNSQVMDNCLEDVGDTVAVSMSLGNAVDELSDNMMRSGNLDEAYMADCICDEFLLMMYEQFNEHYSRTHKKYVSRYIFVGDKISVAKIPDILSYIEYGVAKHSTSHESAVDGNSLKHSTSHESAADEGSSFAQKETLMRNLTSDAHIRANEYGVLKPSKSVIFFAVLSDDSETKCQGICMNCSKKDCENHYQDIQTARKNQDVSSNAKNLKDSEIREKLKESRTGQSYGSQRIFNLK